MANSSGGKGGGKGSSPAAKTDDSDFNFWAEKEKKKVKWNNWFSNSPKEPKRKKLEEVTKA